MFETYRGVLIRKKRVTTVTGPFESIAMRVSWLPKAVTFGNRAVTGMQWSFSQTRRQAGSRVKVAGKK
jgi:hypothetical protein